MLAKVRGRPPLLFRRVQPVALVMLQRGIRAAVSAAAVAWDGTLRFYELLLAVFAFLPPLMMLSL